MNRNRDWAKASQILMSNYSIEKWKKERVLNLCSQYSYACMYSSDVMRKILQSTCKVCIINRVSRNNKALKFSSP